MNKTTKIAGAAFRMSNLSVLAFCNRFTQWHYKAEGSINETRAPGFFDLASDMLDQSDMVIVTGSDGARMVCVTITHTDAGARRVQLVPMVP